VGVTVWIASYNVPVANFLNTFFGFNDDTFEDVFEVVGGVYGLVGANLGPKFKILTMGRVLIELAV